eukprot:5329-Hanusia_phi.AAC.1
MHLDDAIASLFPHDVHPAVEDSESAKALLDQFLSCEEECGLDHLLWWEEDQTLVEGKSPKYEEASERSSDDSDEAAPADQIRSHQLPKKSKKRQAKIQGSVQKRWSKDEHERFLEGLRLYCPYAGLSRGDRGKVFVGLGAGIAQAIACMVGTRTELQVRSHAQKYFLKHNL